MGNGYVGRSGRVVVHMLGNGLFSRVHTVVHHIFRGRGVIRGEGVLLGKRIFFYFNSGTLIDINKNLFVLIAIFLTNKLFSKFYDIVYFFLLNICILVYALMTHWIGCRSFTAEV